MALESLPKISPANFSPDNDLIQVYSKKGDYVGVINPSYIKTSPSGVSGAIQFSDGSAFASDAANLFWDDANNRLGIGVTSSTALTAQLSVGNTDFVVGANAGYSTYYGSSINGTIQATSSGSTTQLWFRANGNAINQNDNFWSRIEQVDGGAMRILSSRYTSLVLGTNGYNNALTLYNSSAFTMPKVGINNSTPTALLQLGGVGSTSATTSLLVQNSGGTNTFKVQDDGAVLLGVTSTPRNDWALNVGGSLSLRALNSAADILGVYNNTTLSAYINGGGDIRTLGKIGVGSSALMTFQASAKLQIDSTTEGFLPPRMTDAQIRAIATPAEGLVAYNTTISHLCVYQAGAWVKLSHSPM